MKNKVDFYELIENRRSVRSYDPDKNIEKDIINRILQAGISAPTAKNLQPGKFLLITNKEKLKEIGTCYSREWFKNAPAVLAVVGNQKNAYVREPDGYNSLEIDLTIMMDHIILAAEYEGLATCWVVAFDNQKLKKTLNLKDDDFICCITPLGYPPEGYKKRDMPKRKSFEEIVEFID